MSLKPVEMQIAIPRTSEATMTQNQLNHKPLVDQQQLADQTLRKTEHTGQRTNQVDAAFEAKIKDDGKRQGGHPNSRQRNRQQAPAESNGAEAPQHPYKGRHIDLSL